MQVLEKTAADYFYDASPAFASGFLSFMDRCVGEFETLRMDTWEWQVQNMNLLYRPLYCGLIACFGKLHMVKGLTSKKAHQCLARIRKATAVKPKLDKRRSE